MGSRSLTSGSIAFTAFESCHDHDSSGGETATNEAIVGWANRQYSSTNGQIHSICPPYHFVRSEIIAPRDSPPYPDSPDSYQAIVGWANRQYSSTNGQIHSNCPPYHFSPPDQMVINCSTTMNR
ncbi:hypothetical protein [Moorena producens]|uniref:hypothetical protein n=1 Tax=Moorena producens TaxID=1155739 RepID=UPI0011EA6887|nr:hypothetical protein [Moorena producens]